PTPLLEAQISCVTTLPPDGLPAGATEERHEFEDEVFHERHLLLRSTLRETKLSRIRWVRFATRFPRSASLLGRCRSQHVLGRLLGLQTSDHAIQRRQGRQRDGLLRVL